VHQRDREKGEDHENSIILRALMAFGLCLAAPQTALSQTGIPMADITSIWNAWSTDSLAVRTNAPEISNGCSTAGIYVTDPANPASRLIQSMIISAYMARRKIALTVSGCLLGNAHPIIISVSVEP